ncbi:hypothetical protein [Leptospira sp. severe_002]|nr:hypothetical protein [Leptospira sp. severe_002]
MDQTFNVANGMQTVGNWDVFVFQGVLPEATELSRNSYDLLATFPE